MASRRAPQVKKALKADDGSFRATFEDKLLRSDLVLLKAWAPVTIPTVYNPVTSLLVPHGQGWLRMRTAGETRAALQLEVPLKKDALYKPIERKTRRFNALTVPKALQAALPFKSKPKLDQKQARKSLQARRAVVAEPEERRANTFMQQLHTMHNERERKRKKKATEKKADFEKKVRACARPARPRRMQCRPPWARVVAACARRGPASTFVARSLVAAQA